ncbi:Zn(II)2Cys6 transcription factor [Aspergillus neoniger CBS 115656]|uniref:Zn(2)-C6 fungal-type domain-containing protein n=1 Tax=Aspergillus neoniger (strain CBS 115656) TaxID=1448310 RepID=A0A318Y6Q5_ASPNB|nr:hypothetical protein BO87DRAFT_446712 [Aspergillus neoniger CBS 115656]PYH29966.1 hypothetical protein BO87DRAFT_446712 [Aspergillus neoniger CBS 115656]
MLTSCYTCRRRHVECQMTLPPCKKCLKAGLECLQKRPLRWVDGPAFRNKLRTSQAHRLYQPSTFNKATDEVSSICDSGLAAPTFEAIAPGERNGQSTVSHNRGHSSIHISIPPSLKDPAFDSLDDASMYYLNYYSRCVCKLFAMFDSQRNPLRQLIPAALANPILTASVMAISARHMANGQQLYCERQDGDHATRFQAHPDGLMYKQKAIRGLIQALNDPVPKSRDVLVLSAFILIFLDLLESGRDQWKSHLGGIKQLVHDMHTAGTSQNLEATIEGMREFILGQIYLIETLGATFSGRKVLSGADMSLAAPLQMSIDRAYIGCPEYLLSAVRFFSAARDRLTDPRYLDTPETYSLLQSVTSVLNSTNFFDCYGWANQTLRVSSLTPKTQNVQSLEHLAQAYKSATLIYGWRICDALTGNNTPLSDLVTGLVHEVHILRKDEAIFKCILWPLFIAGLESEDQAQRSQVREFLDSFWFETKCINVINAVTILERLWVDPSEVEDASCSWIFRMGQVEGDWLLI